MKILYLCLLLAILPTEKIQCRTTDLRVAVECTDDKLVKTLFEKHGLKHKWDVEKSSFILVVGEWKNKNPKYNEARDLFFDLAKRKEVLRIY